jgi:1-acyl-sn-glycerol-3-phosphate acyltransferase
MSLIFKLFKPLFDFLLTLLFWLYTIFGFLFFYLPVLVFLSFFINSREIKFQKMNHYYYLGFFRGLNALTPGLSFNISKSVTKINSSIIISNHRSYLDPILLISIFPRHKTIVKGIFFKIPFISWAMKSGGYIPFSPSKSYNDFLAENLKNIPEFFQSGGNLFIFPEGRRSRDGRIRKFQKGAFSIAIKHQIPIEVIYINNTDRLFTPGKFFLNTCIKNIISVEKIGTIEPLNTTANEMRAKAICLYEGRIKAEAVPADLHKRLDTRSHN